MRRDALVLFLRSPKLLALCTVVVLNTVWTARDETFFEQNSYEFMGIFHLNLHILKLKTLIRSRYLKVFVYPVNQTVYRIIHFFIEMNQFQWTGALRGMSHKTRMWIIHQNSKWFIQILPNLARSLPRLKTNPVNVEAREENSNQLLQVRKIQKLKKKNQKVKAWVRYHNE